MNGKKINHLFHTILIVDPFLNVFHASYICYWKREEKNENNFSIDSFLFSVLVQIDLLSLVTLLRWKENFF